MFTKIFLFLSICAAFASVSPAQTINLQHTTAVKLSVGSDSFDPLGILEYEEDGGDESRVKPPVVVSMVGVERTAFDLINKKRAEFDLAPLVWNEDIAAVARVHSRSMAEFSFFSHRGLDNKLVSDRADAQKVVKWRAIGENIAFNRGYKDPVQKAVELWLDSPTHRRNLMDETWRESAVGVAVAPDGSYYFTQVFLVRR